MAVAARGAPADAAHGSLPSTRACLQAHLNGQTPVLYHFRFGFRSRKFDSKWYGWVWGACGSMPLSVDDSTVLLISVLHLLLSLFATPTVQVCIVEVTCHSGRAICNSRKLVGNNDGWSYNLEI